MKSVVLNYNWRYYLTGKEIPDHIWHSDPHKKNKVKKWVISSISLDDERSTLIPHFLGIHELVCVWTGLRPRT